MDLKVRDRTNKELSIRKKEFLKICNILDNIGIKYFLNTGILLGAVRDNNFIKWDWDVEISLFADEFYSKIDLITNKLRKTGFKIIQINNKKDNLKIDFIGACSKDTTKYTIFSWNYSNYKDVYWRKGKSIPSKFLNKFSKISLFGRQFNCPYNPKEYLKFSYGNWRKPIRTSNKELYMSKNFKKKSLFLIVVTEKILVKIYSLWKMIKNFSKL
jgi:lipopolysaccharide cholinephosphotransferase